MKYSLFVTNTALICAVALPLSARAATPVQSITRWISADNVSLRVGPNLEDKVIGSLSRGDEILFEYKNNNYCAVETANQYGYVACQYLSTERIKRPRSGENGVDAAQRWVSGNAVTLREAPNLDAAIVGRMGVNTVVKLLRNAEGGYCEIQLSSDKVGFTACRYLAITPVVRARVPAYRVAEGKLPAEYDPEREFWLEPSWDALEAYVAFIQRRHPEIPLQGPWPRNEALERMKAHLALGLNGRKPLAYVDWLSLKRKASMVMDLSGEIRRLQSPGKKITDDIQRRDRQLQEINSQVAKALDTSNGIEGAPLNQTISYSDVGVVAPAIHLVQALEFTKVAKSLFHDEAEIAPPGSSTEEASGRFGIIFRQILTPRPKPKSGTGKDSDGLYDMLTRTQLLVRPVQRMQLFRDGRLYRAPSLLRQEETLRDIGIDESPCSNLYDGFSFGDADKSIWRFFGDGAAFSAKFNINPAGSLYAFYTTIELPRTTAVKTEIPMKLNRETTGFVRGLYLYYDLDGDGVPDLAVWEGQGKGPGHLEDVVNTDDRWYRLALVNISGVWKVLGVDAFSYGCGD